MSGQLPKERDLEEDEHEEDARGDGRDSGVRPSSRRRSHWILSARRKTQINSVLISCSSSICACWWWRPKQWHSFCILSLFAVLP